MDRLETREFAYFVAVAEACHFGRAAERLGIAQPPLSRAIDRIERRLGIRLLERTSRRVALTPAGEALLVEARRVLDAVDAAVARTRQAAQSLPRLRLVLKPGTDAGLLAPILEGYRDEPHATEVDVHTCRPGEQPALLRRGAADVAFVHGSQRDRDDLDGLDTELLLVEPQVAVLPLGHRLAGARYTRMADVADELMPVEQLLTNPQQALQLVALGRAALLLPASAHSQLRHDVVCVPVVDAAPVELLLAWSAEHRAPMLAAFVRVATRVAAETMRATAPTESADVTFHPKCETTRQ